MDLLAKLTSRLSGVPPVEDFVRQAIERGVSIVDPLIKVVPGYDHKLAATTRDALSYCFKLVSEISGPIDINRRTFNESPLVHALFSGNGQIHEMFGKSQSVRDLLADASALRNNEFFGLLGMRRHERKVLGVGLYGERVRYEVPQTLLYFADHTLLSLSAELEETHNIIGNLAFDSLARSFAEELKQLRNEKQDLHRQWELARAAKGERERRALPLPELEKRLRDASERLMPESVISAYREWMASPTSHLRIDRVTLNVDRLGVVQSLVGDQEHVGDTISFSELVSRDRRRWIVMLVRIRKEDMIQAVESFKQSSRYMLI